MHPIRDSTTPALERALSAIRKPGGHSNEESTSTRSPNCVQESHSQSFRSNRQSVHDVADGSSKRDPLFVDTLRTACTTCGREKAIRSGSLLRDK